MKKKILTILLTIIVSIGYFIIIFKYHSFVFMVYTIFIFVVVYGFKYVKIKLVLQNGEWRTAFVEKCSKCFFDKGYYNISIKLEDETILKKKCILGNDTLRTLKSGYEIRALVYKNDFLLEEDIELYSDVIILKKYTERHKKELEKE